MPSGADGERGEESARHENNQSPSGSAESRSRRCAGLSGSAMRRGELYRVSHPSSDDPKRHRVFIVVSRQVLIDSRFSTVICAPIYTVNDGLSTQIPVGPNEGLKHASSIHCDELVSLPKSKLTNYAGMLSSRKLQMLDEALKISLNLDE